MSTSETLESNGGATGASGLARPQLFAAAIVLLLANAAAAKAIDAVALSGPLAALLGGLGLSWAFWLAFAASVRLALREAAVPAHPRDLWMCAACAFAALVPLSPIAALACSALAGAILLDRSQGRFIKAAAWVLLAISLQLVWARLLMMVFVRPVADVDAHLVSLIINRPVRGNGVLFVDRSHTLTILGACTSVQNASTALMLYVAIVRSFRPVPRLSEAFVVVGLFASVVALNLVRLALMAQNIEMFHLVHGDVGAAVVNGVITFTGLAWAVGSVRREVFD